MSKFRKTLAVFLAGLPYASSDGKVLPAGEPKIDDSAGAEPVDLRPMNSPGANLFAGHRSHSSHRSHTSHSSHRSSSGGGYYTPPAPSTPASPPASSSPPGLYQAPTTTTRPPQSTAPTQKDVGPQLTREEKLRIQVMRVQVALTMTGLYTGAVHGQFDESTKLALRRFQLVKGLEENGLMTTATLDALSVLAVE